MEKYLHAVVGHDWDALAGCLTQDVVRTGPFGDTYSPREPYVAFLAGLMPTLPGYAMDVERVVYADAETAFAQLSETVEIDGQPVVTPETLVFELRNGLIARIRIYIQRQG